MNKPEFIENSIQKENEIIWHGNEPIHVNTHLKQNNIPVLEENLFRKMWTDGFSKKREFQRIGRIPYVAYLQAEKEGYNMSNEEDVITFLERHPEFMTVNTTKPVGNKHLIRIK